MPTPLEYVQARAPAFALKANITTLLSQAELETGDNYCGSEDMHNKAVALLTCHWLAMAERDLSGTGPSGTITSEKEGDLARSFGNMLGENNNSFLSQTSWGCELIQLQNSTMILPTNRFI